MDSSIKRIAIKVSKQNRGLSLIHSTKLQWVYHTTSVLLLDLHCIMYMCYSPNKTEQTEIQKKLQKFYYKLQIIVVLCTLFSFFVCLVKNLFLEQHNLSGDDSW